MGLGKVVQGRQRLDCDSPPFPFAVSLSHSQIVLCFKSDLALDQKLGQVLYKCYRLSQ